MIINIHAGHNPDGKVACGASGFIQESTEARKVKNEVVNQLRQMGHTVYDCTCDNGIGQADVLTKIVNMCNINDADLDVSIHFNAGAGDVTGNGRTSGTEVYIYDSHSKSKQCAENVAAAIAALGFKNRGVKYSTSLYVLRKTKAPAMLIECCFVDDKDDVQLYDYQEMAKAIVFGITGQSTLKSDIVIGDIDTDASETDAETIVGSEKSIYRVQVGAYSVKSNAEQMANHLKVAGYDAIIVKA